MVYVVRCRLRVQIMASSLLPSGVPNPSSLSLSPPPSPLPRACCVASFQMPKKGKIYSVNEGNAKNWDAPTKA